MLYFIRIRREKHRERERAYLIISSPHMVNWQIGNMKIHRREKVGFYILNFAAKLFFISLHVDFHSSGKSLSLTTSHYSSSRTL